MPPSRERGRAQGRISRCSSPLRIPLKRAIKPLVLENCGLGRCPSWSVIPFAWRIQAGPGPTGRSQQGDPSRKPSTVPWASDLGQTGQAGKAGQHEGALADLVERGFGGGLEGCNARGSGQADDGLSRSSSRRRDADGALLRLRCSLLAAVTFEARSKRFATSVPGGLDLLKPFAVALPGFVFLSSSSVSAQDSSEAGAASPSLRFGKWRPMRARLAAGPSAGKDQPEQRHPWR